MCIAVYVSRGGFLITFCLRFMNRNKQGTIAKAMIATFNRRYGNNSRFHFGDAACVLRTDLADLNKAGEMSMHVKGPDRGC